MSKRQEETLSRKIKKGLAVCPKCRDIDHINRSVFIREGETLFSIGKLYRCESGHISVIAPLTNCLNVEFGPGSEDFVNIEGTLEELPKLLDDKEIACHHNNCDQTLVAVDDFQLSYPSIPGIKTKTRVGDVWDKQGLEPVRPGSYDNNGNYQSTKSEIANRHRLERMRERNVPIDKIPGTRITKPTNNKYGRRSKDQIDFS